MPEVTCGVKTETWLLSLALDAIILFIILFHDCFHEAEGTLPAAVDTAMPGALWFVSGLEVRLRAPNLDSIFQSQSIFFTSVISSDLYFTYKETQSVEKLNILFKM